MNMERSARPILSICIPTYNRPIALERLLINLIPQLDERMEIVVRDDSQNQDSVKIFEKLTLQKKYSTQYYKGEKIGVDAANLFLLEKAKGEYIWWFSDDDTLLENGIKALIDIIKGDPNINFVWANFSYQNISTLVLDRPSEYFKSGSDVIEYLGVNIGLMSTYIVKRDIGRLGLEYARKHVNGFSFAATAIVLWVLTQPGNFFFMRGPFVLCNPTTIDEFKKTVIKQDGGIDNPAFDIYGIYFYNVVKGLESKFEYRAVRRLLSLNFGSLWRGILVAWVGGWDSPKGKRMRMLRIYWSYPEFWIALPLFCMPHQLVKYSYWVYKIFFRHRKLVFWRNIHKMLNK